MRLHIRNLRIDILNLLACRLHVDLACFKLLLHLLLLQLILPHGKRLRTIVNTSLFRLAEPELLTPLVCRNDVLGILVALGGNLLVKVCKRVCGLDIAGKLCLRDSLLDLGKRLGLRGLLKTVGTACVVTWFNPQAIIDGTLMLGAFAATLSAQQATPFITGVETASVMWFLGVTLVVNAFAHKFNPKIIGVLNRVCGGIIVLYGIKLLVDFAMAVL